MGAADPAAREQAWEAMADRWIGDGPLTDHWRVNREARAGDLSQGWKLHVSATILSAPTVLERAGPVLASSGVRYKASRSLLELKRLNCGLFYGYPQVGKFLTVYPRSTEEACVLAAELDNAVQGLAGPAVPFERRCFPDGTVFRRYGAFDSALTKAPEARPAVRRPDGVLEEDRRDRTPPWAPPDPFDTPPPRRRRGRLAREFRSYEAVSQRGKGGVYLAIDVRSGVRRCIIKEGRRHGEVDWDGTDGRARVEHESVVLRNLRSEGLPVPAVFASFRERGAAYLALEAIPGRTLQATALRGRAKLTIGSALEIGRECARVVARIHKLGWTWRDCKPANLVLDGNTLRPLDFEGAVREDSDRQLPWGTAGYVPPEWLDSDAACRPVTPAQDLYALGASLHAVFSGETPPPMAPPRPVGVHRHGVPRTVRELIAALLDDAPERRPSATAAARTLTRAAT